MTAGSATPKRYLEDPYTHRFKTDLIRCDERKDGFVAVLRETWFYPESGGQTADHGDIAGVQVLDVFEDDQGVVYHTLESRLDPGAVECRIDGKRRFDHMQQHTAQHLLSRALIEIGGNNTLSFHMGDDTCTIDVEGDPDGEVLARAEGRVNEIIWQNRVVDIRNVGRAEVEDADLRKKIPDGVTEVRLVVVDDFDTIGCCGTHVRTTGEIGLLKVLKTERVKGCTRVVFKAGMRALADYSIKHVLTSDLAARFTTSVDDLGGKIDKLTQEAAHNRKALQKVSKRLAAFEAQALTASAPEHAGVKCVVEIIEDCDDDYLRLLSAELKQSAATINILAGKSGVIVCNASKDVAVDFTKPVVERARALGGSGGGKGGFANVQLPDSVSASEFLQEAFAQLKAALTNGAS
jgi:alanyl-tRNA synthetase